MSHKFGHFWPPLSGIVFPDLAQRWTRGKGEFWVSLSKSNIFLLFFNKNIVSLKYSQSHPWNAERQTLLQLLKPRQWPPNSPDLNLIDFGIWKLLEQNVYCDRKIVNSILWTKPLLKSGIKFRKKSLVKRARSLVVSDLRSETKASRFKSGCQLCAEVNSLQ